MSYCCENMSITTANSSESSERNFEGTLCRLCMKENDYYYNIFFSIAGSQITVKGALGDFVDLQVAVGDGLHATICTLCLKKLVEVNDFRNICHESDAELTKFSCRNDLRMGFLRYVKCRAEANLENRKSPPSVYPNNIWIL
ncbi:uncharacterized protein LOC124170251 [Ischnura elegans]|uniref:uncharacterized protein LOC124170251 n=1 Tax=Ischnura elegans TaxID=197161 RepID=UPI001ED8B776|nr:uncharacterized protein LOC124170251 [Ischnura elegans]